jgi:hypothetical protein
MKCHPSLKKGMKALKSIRTVIRTEPFSRRMPRRPPQPPNRARTQSSPHAAPNLGIKQADDRIWLFTFMDYDLGYFVSVVRVFETVSAAN